jgi:hypothetical protein
MEETSRISFRSTKLYCCGVPGSWGCTLHRALEAYFSIPLSLVALLQAAALTKTTLFDAPRTRGTRLKFEGEEAVELVWGFLVSNVVNAYENSVVFQFPLCLNFPVAPVGLGIIERCGKASAGDSFL